MQETLNVQPGDEVAIRRGLSDSYSLFTVKSVDGKGIITIENGSRYRSDGSPLAKGDKWNHPSHILPVTDRIREAIEKSNLVGRLSHLNWKDWEAMSVETLRAIVSVIDGEQ